MRILFAALLAASFSVSAGDLVLRSKADGSELRLYDTPCVNGETLAKLNAEWRDKFKAAKILNAKGHIEWYGCWIQHDEIKVYVMFQDGDGQWFDLSMFSDPSV